MQRGGNVRKFLLRKGRTFGFKSLMTEPSGQQGLSHLVGRKKEKKKGNILVRGDGGVVGWVEGMERFLQIFILSGRHRVRTSRPTLGDAITRRPSCQQIPPLSSSFFPTPNCNLDVML